MRIAGKTLNRRITTAILTGRISAIAMACVVLTSCSNSVTGLPAGETINTSSDSKSPRQTDENGVQLPFDNTFSDRWNSSNDGTSYEPCTVDKRKLTGIGIDASSVRDAAIVDGQSLRGCRWKYLPPKTTFQDIYQAVVNSESLEWYKIHNSIGNIWLPDRVVDGRSVGTASDKSGGCIAYLQSGAAAVITGASYNLTPSLPVPEICGYVIDMVTATIDKIPK
ncbi:DUF3558 domain-containing protein [Streptomyces sp. SID6673]|nr:DUF3558 domain-containing protein [Streptomyces sp. SID11726]NDZ94871.1 DUF3558 domain-containing protein [Streptomyces sp. SID11726]NEB23031.1 DUF3558 domain-containing protein [Streptomyces sp. SID6673]